MRVVIQRVSRASVSVEGREPVGIGRGLAILLGIAKTDKPNDADFLVNKISHLRIFPDDEGRMNKSLVDTGGALFIVPNFTLYANTRKGRRPSFEAAAAPVQARELYLYFVARARAAFPVVETGEFQAHMSVQVENDGPVTLICDSN